MIIVFSSETTKLDFCFPFIFNLNINGIEMDLIIFGALFFVAFPINKDLKQTVIKSSTFFCSYLSV